jgi:hypothetical protein
MDDLRHLIEDGAVSPHCEFCGHLITGPVTITHGGEPMHEDCYRQLGWELARLDEALAEAFAEVEGD